MPAYRFIIAVITPLVKLLYPHRVIGAENIPDGAAVVCGNHSSYIDPVLIAVAFTSRRMVHFMGKAEIFKNPFFRWFFTKIGAFPVRRGEQDIAAIKNSMRFLKEGTKVMIFPEGTRVGRDNEAAAKTGAVRIADKMKAPVVPVYMPRDKKMLRKTVVVIGEPYMVSEEETRCDYQAKADELMVKISGLRERAL